MVLAQAFATSAPLDGLPGVATSAVRVGGVGSEVAWDAKMDKEKPNQVAEGNLR